MTIEAICRTYLKNDRQLNDEHVETVMAALKYFTRQSEKYWQTDVGDVTIGAYLDSHTLLRATLDQLAR